ncbi:hypothetical protein [Halobacteriovorax sp. CON-3]|uniref:hypothetical protein n=1 Tax=Halobacteriovorax sp. CON-3 TaxID=3157710 RepID=UPI00372332FF
MYKKLVSMLIVIGSHNALFASVSFGESLSNLSSSTPNIVDDRVDKRMVGSRTTPHVSGLGVSTLELQSLLRSARKKFEEKGSELTRLPIIPDLPTKNTKEVNNNAKNDNSDKSKPSLPRKGSEVTDSVSSTASAPIRRSSKTAPKKPKKRSVQNSSITFFNTHIPTENLDKNALISAGASSMGELMLKLEIDTSSEKDKDRADIRLHGAFVGPNKLYVDMSNCHIIFKPIPKYNTERVKGELKRISCVSDDGKEFNEEIKGHIRDAEDEAIGLKAITDMTNMQKGGAWAAGSAITKAIGGGLAQTQVTSEISQSSGIVDPVTISNITGSQGAFVAGKAIEASLGKHADKMRDYYWNLVPPLVVEGGREVIVWFEEGLEVPVKYLKKESKDDLLFDSLSIY